MSVKKTVSKKVAVKKEAKAPVVKAPKVMKSKVTLVQFEMSAVIPTMQYGNIQPKITVTAPSMEEARDIVMPIIVELYRAYGERPLAGREVKPVSVVTATEKVVEAPKAQEVAPKAPEVVIDVPAPQPVAEAPVAPVAPIVAPTVPAETPEAVRKAEKAISLAATEEALKLIEGQITNSVKIDPSYKPALLTLVEEKIRNLAF